MQPKPRCAAAARPHLRNGTERAAHRNRRNPSRALRPPHSRAHSAPHFPFPHSTLACLARSARGRSTPERGSRRTHECTPRPSACLGTRVRHVRRCALQAASSCCSPDASASSSTTARPSWPSTASPSSILLASFQAHKGSSAERTAPCMPARAAVQRSASGRPPAQARAFAAIRHRGRAGVRRLLSAASERDARPHIVGRRHASVRTACHSGRGLCRTRRKHGNGVCSQRHGLRAAHERIGAAACAHALPADPPASSAYFRANRRFA